MGESGDCVSVVDAPQTHRAIITSGHDESTSRVERDKSDRLAVAHLVKRNIFVASHGGPLVWLGRPALELRSEAL